jgi:hypothetical protein
MEKRLSDLQTILTLYGSDKTAIAEKTADIRKYFFTSKSHLSPVRIIYDEAPEGGYNSDYLDISIEDLTSESLKIDSRYVWIDNILPSGVISLLESHRTMHLKDFAKFSRYDINLLSKIRDFRTLVNLQYVKQLAHELGISTTLDPVLSFPLGPNAITILEAAQAYQSIMTGSLFTIDPEINSPEMVPIITRIVDRNGVTIWEYEKRPQKVLSKRVTSSLIEMLRMVVEEGTGRRARGSIQMSVGFENGKMEIPVPCFGKTGTANRFTNSSFIGFIPGLDPESGEFDTQEGYVIASYVGYDDNAPMKGPNIRIAGASGALPVWIDTSSGVAGSPEYKKNIHVPDLAFLDWSKPLISGNNMQPVRVSGISGLRAEESSEEFSTDQMVETWSFIVKNGSFINAAREFDPIEGVPHE